MYKLLRNNKKGFTLIELIVVIAILAILAAIAIPTFSGIRSNAEAKVDLANARVLATSINAHNNLNPGSEIDIESKDLAKDLGDLFPSGLSADDLTEALKLITYSNYVAVAAEPAPSTT